MKTSELLSKLNRFTSRIAGAMRRLAEVFFGNFSWRPPGWLNRTVAGCGRFERAHPRLIPSAMIVILVICCSGAWTWNWYSHLPKPKKVSAKIVPIEVTKLEKELKFQRLVIYFSESAARLDGPNVFSANDPAAHLPITYELQQRVAYIHSSPIVLPDQEDFLKLAVTKGVRTAQGGAQTRDTIEEKLRIPSVASMFQIDSIQTTIARDKNGEPEQLIVLTTTADISTRELAKALQIRLLPKRKVSEAEKEAEVESSEEGDQTSEDSGASNEETDSDDDSVGSQVKETELWKSATDVLDDVLEAARPVVFAPVESEKPQGRQHAFRLRVESDGELYVRVNNGVRAFGGFPLSEDYSAVVNVPALPRQVQIEGQGGLLALNGERKLSIRSRGLNAIEYEIARVATTQINHLVSQTEGKFQHPRFQVSDLFNEEK